MDLYYRVYYRVDIHLTWICFVEDGYPVIKRCIPYTYLFLLKPYLKKYLFYFFVNIFFIILFSYHKYIVHRIFRVVLCSRLNFPFWTLTQTFIKIKVSLCPNVFVHVRTDWTGNAFVHLHSLQWLKYQLWDDGGCSIPYFSIYDHCNKSSKQSWCKRLVL